MSITWDDALRIICEGKLLELIRSTEQMEEYSRAKSEMKASHGGVAQFVQIERLQWIDPTPAAPHQFLGAAQDVKILVNDFSYDFEPGILHLVVWSKVRCSTNADEFPTPESAARIEEFLQRTLTDMYGIPRERIAWFKNTRSLQSVRSLEHFHVLIRRASPELPLVIGGTSGYLR